MDILDRLIFDWSVLDWLRAAGLTAIVAALLLLFRTLFSRHFGRIAEKTKTQIDDVVVALIRGTRLFFIVVASFVIVVTVFTAPEGVDGLLRRVFVVALLLQAGLWGNDLIRVGTSWYLARKEGDEVDASRETAFKAFSLVAKLALWSILFLLSLDNFGVDITALVTGLGISGIAVALAVQNVLKDILAYVSILIDKPFVIGDYLVVGDMSGSVETIGIKSTRIRSLSGEQLIFSNEDLLGSRIRNYKRMYERRISFKVGVEYGTPASKLEAIPGILREAVEAQTDVRFDRAHLKSFDDFAITFETVYYVLQPEYATYMDRQQSINMLVYTRFDDEGIVFAFPTQTIHVASEPERTTD